MKKLINITLALSFFIYLMTIYLSNLNKLYFIIKHLSLYVFLALVALKIIEYFYIKVINKAEHKDTLRSFIHIMKVIVFGLSLIFIGFIQTTYIAQKETLHIRGCQYYDTYNHIIYQSIYDGECSELENYLKGDNYISFTVNESTKGNYTFYFVDNVQGTDGVIEDAYLEFNSKTDVEIHYDELNRIRKVNFRSTELITVKKDNQISYVYSSYFRDISNTYHLNDFESIIQSGEIHDVNYLPQVDNEMIHYAFLNQELLTKKIYSKTENINDKEQVINVFKESIIDNELNVERIANSHVTINEDGSNKKIHTDILVQGISGLKRSTDLSIVNGTIHFDIFETTEDSSYVSHHITSWEPIRDFENVVLKKQILSSISELNYDYKRSYDFIRDSILLEGYRIYELKHTEFGKLNILYTKPNRSLFEESYQETVEKNKVVYHHFDLINKSYDLFDYETMLTQTKSSNDVIHQSIPIFERYYNK